MVPRGPNQKVRSLERQVNRELEFPSSTYEARPISPGFFLKNSLIATMASKMLAPIRRTQTFSILPRLAPYVLPIRLHSTSDRTSDRVPTNDPSPPKAVRNVSDSNAVPISPQGLRDSDRPLQELPEDSERQRAMQAPNREEPWSRSQQPRERAMSGPRFEQTIMEYQVRTINLEDPFSV